MSRWISLVALLMFAPAALAQGRYAGIGRPATPAEVAAWDIDVRGDFAGLPAGSGSVRKGETVWEAKCASCHGSFGESNAMFPPIAGGTTLQDIERGRVAALTRPEQRTTLMKLSQLSTLWDYINRAMPWNAPKSLETDEVYAVTAYVLSLGRIVPDDFVLSNDNIAQVQKRLPNRDGMARWTPMWKTRGTGDVRNPACMKDCSPDPRILSRLPEAARDAHGNLAEQGRAVGPVRGWDTTRGLASATTATAAARPLAEKSGCLACHGASQRVVGPSLAEIAARYRTDDGAEPRLVEKVKSGGQGSWGAIPMPPQPQLRENEIRTLVRWILTGD